MIDKSRSNPENIDKTERLIDANINRLREGIRVLEDISRYIYSDQDISHRLKKLRHIIKKAYDPARLRYRDIDNDVLKESLPEEMSRRDVHDMISANFSRTEESSRVLEEAFKLKDGSLSGLFKSIRYELYALEKDFFTAEADPDIR